MGKGKLWPSANTKPLNRSSPNLNGVITLWTPTTKKLSFICPGVFVPHIGEIYTLLFEICYTFFGSSTRLQASLLDRFLRLIRQMTWFCAKKCLFHVFDIFIRKIRKKLQWRLWGKFNNSLNCHNFRCVQDRVVIFGSRIGYLGSP